MYSSILLAIDLEASDSWAKALPVSQALARTFRARLTLCTVVTNADAQEEAQWSPIGLRQLVGTAQARLQSLAADQDMDIGTDVAIGSVRHGIIDAAERAGADLIVLASHRPEMKDYLLGANASRIVRHAPCSVLVVRGLPAQAN